MPSYYNPLSTYNTSPTPVTGQGPYGKVPGNIGVPPSIYDQAIAAIPGLGAAATPISGNILSELQGEIDPQALRNMQDSAASYGVSSGMPGTNAIPGTLAFNKNLRNIGLDTYAVKQQGLRDYLSTLAGVGAGQTSQATAADIANRNATLNAAPDPTQAAAQQLQNYWAALLATRGPGGGTTRAPMPSGGTGVYSPPAQQGGFYPGGGTPSMPTSPPGSYDQTQQDWYWQGWGDYPTSSSYTPIDYTGIGQGPVGGGVANPYGPSDYSFQNAWDFTDPMNWNQTESPDFSNYSDALYNPDDYYGAMFGGF